jgi:hypothetical protein
VAHAAFVHARSKASWGLVDAPASRSRRRWAAEGDKRVSASLTAAPLLFELGLGLGFRGVCSGILSGFFSGVLLS